MVRRSAILVFLSLAILAAVSHEVTAQGWALLGSREVSDRVDHDAIVVTALRGDFRGVKLTVERSAVRFYRMVVHFGNGGSQELEIRNIIPAGGETRVIDLRGDERIIRSIEFWYEAKSIGPRGAMVRAFARR